MIQRRSQDFCLGGGHPVDATRYIFRDLQKPTRFAGEMLKEISAVSFLRRTRFGGGGGVVAEFVSSSCR